MIKNSSWQPGALVQTVLALNSVSPMTNPASDQSEIFTRHNQMQAQQPLTTLTTTPQC